MLTMRKRFSVTAVLVAAFALSVPLVAGAANDLATISGRVQDSSGTPSLALWSSRWLRRRYCPNGSRLTDRDGGVFILNLFAGEYTVRVSMSKFPAGLK